MSLAKTFMMPPEEFRPWCYWWWLNGAASKEGITRDFEEMKKQGIGGALLFDAGRSGARGAARAAFHEPRVARAVQARPARGRPLRHRAGREPVQRLERRRAVGDARARRQEDRRRGDRRCKGPGQRRASPCRSRRRCTGSIATSPCWPGRVAEGGSPQPKLSASSSYRDYLPALAQDGSSDTRWISNGDKPGMGPTPREARVSPVRLRRGLVRRPGCTCSPIPDCGPKEIEIQCSDDGKTYRTLRRATVAPHQEVTLPFDEVRAKHFRVVFLSSHPFQRQGELERAGGGDRPVDPRRARSAPRTARTTSGSAAGWST